MTRNAVIMQAYVGRMIESIQDTNTGQWTDPDGFIIRFTDGTAIEISADMGQGAGYVIVEEVK